ncbi:MAG TPA: SH3 domain-containing C40 family peptidase [Ruminiclostridium sp.]|nr:SH3 domain-containing C40 family peptidase [Ruminiclostridium sp.]
MLVKNLYKAVSVTCFTVLFIGASTGFVYGKDLQTGTAAVNTLNLRKSPDTSSKILDQLTKGERMSLIGSSHGWYKVSENGKTGWVSAEYVSLKKGSQSSSSHTSTLTGNNINLRKGPGISHGIVKKLSKNDKLLILKTSGNWYKVRTSDGSIGWVSSKYISAKAKRNTKTNRGESSLPTEIADFAARFLGVKYTYGGVSPETGFDCSGFTKYVFERFGIGLERVAADQATQGVKVSKEDLRPGDLVFSDTDGGNNNISHVGIYIGRGKFISADSGPSSGKIVIQSLDSSYWQKVYMTARRVI